MAALPTSASSSRTSTTPPACRSAWRRWPRSGWRRGTLRGARRRQRLAPSRPRRWSRALPACGWSRSRSPGRGRRATAASRWRAAPVVAFLNSDCIPDPGWLAALLAGFAADPACPILGGAVRIFADDPARPNRRRGLRPRLRHPPGMDDRPARLRRDGEPRGAAGGLRRGRRLRRAAHLRGHGVGHAGEGEGLPDPLRPDAVVRHPARARWPTCAGSGTGTSATTGACSRRPRAAGRTGRCAPAAMAASPVGEIPLILRSGRLRAPRQRLDALQGVARMRLYRARRMLAELVDPAGAPAQRPLEPHLTFRARNVSARGTPGLAEREGFEPSRRFPAYTLSRRAPSTTRPPLRRSQKTWTEAGGKPPWRAVQGHARGMHTPCTTHMHASLRRVKPFRARNIRRGGGPV